MSHSFSSNMLNINEALQRSLKRRKSKPGGAQSKSLWNTKEKRIRLTREIRICSRLEYAHKPQNKLQGRSKWKEKSRHKKQCYMV